MGFARGRHQRIDALKTATYFRPSLTHFIVFLLFHIAFFLVSSVLATYFDLSTTRPSF